MMYGLWRHVDDAAWLSRLQPPPQRMSYFKMIGTQPPEFTMSMEARKVQLDEHKLVPSPLSRRPNSGITWDGLWKHLQIYTSLHRFVVRRICLTLLILFVFLNTNSRQDHSNMSSLHGALWHIYTDQRWTENAITRNQDLSSVKKKADFHAWKLFPWRAARRHTSKGACKARKKTSKTSPLSVY